MSFVLTDTMDQPIKRKRGRPPKHDKPAEAYPTFTVQFQATPEHAHPNAELNSSRMVQIGEPDAYTPVMRVSPTVHKRRRRSTPTARRSVAAASTPTLSPALLAVTPRVLARVLAHMEMLTMDSPHQLSTPPDSAMRPSFGLFSGLGLSAFPHPLADTSAEAAFPMLHDHDFPSFFEDNLFAYKLVVDDHGRAVLADKLLLPAEPARPVFSNPALLHNPSLLGHYDEQIVPQTPYDPLGAEPKMDGGLPAYNLTPHFNANMHLMMSLESPNPGLDKLCRKTRSYINMVDLCEYDDGDARTALRKVFGR